MALKMAIFSPFLGRKSKFSGDKIKKSKKARLTFCLPIWKVAKTDIKLEKGPKNFLRDKNTDVIFGVFEAQNSQK